MTEQERIVKLENSQVQLKEDLSNLARQHSELFRQQSALDKTLNKLLVKIDNHFIDAQKYEKNIESIAENVQMLRVSYAEGPMQRHREMQKALDPVHAQLREHTKQFVKLKTEIRTEMKGDAKSALGLIWFSIIVICSMGMYIYNSDKTEVRDELKELHEHISKHHPIHGSLPP